MPIRRRLMSMVLMTSGVVLLVSTGASFAYEFLTYRQSAIRNLTTLGAVIADNSTAALAFDNADDARGILAALKAEPHIIAGALYDRQGVLFASYPEPRGDRAGATFPAHPAGNGYRFLPGQLVGFQPVVENGRRLGTLYLESNTQAISDELRLHGIIATLVLAVSCLVAYLMSRALQRQVSQPILLLAEAARVVSDRRDYSVRAPRAAGHELGLLTEAFNHMLTQIQEQDGRLHSQLGSLQLLHHITRAIGERQDLPSVFRVVLGSLEESLPIDFGCICLAEGEILKVASVASASTALAARLQLVEKSEVRIDSNGLARCIKGELVYESDVRELPLPFPQRLAEGGLRSLVIAPLAVENAVVGVLIAARVKEHAFASADCEFLRQLSEHVALAAHQAQLYTALQKAYEELRQSQQTVMQQERLRALGQMASGIAHDINNAISPVSLYTESLLEREPNLSDRARNSLTIIQRSIDDVASTVARMREFYRPREAQLELARIDVNGILRQVVDSTRARWSDLPQQRGVVVELRLETAADLPEVMGAEGEIRDALTNLIFNAVDAMPEGGVLALRTRRIDSPSQGDHGEPLSQVCIEVSDTGIGMDEETRRRCLEPFFTTKGERGTGLGLAMVYGMIQRHSAELELESAPGQGTTFRLVFLSAASDSAVVVRTSVPPLAQRLRILLIDDDPMLLKSLQDALEGDGHLITTTHGGQAGIDSFSAAAPTAGKFDLVITDLGMPHVDGRKVAAAIKSVSNRTPVIMLTGWGHRLIAENDIPPHVDRILSKPPRLQELRVALAELASVAHSTTALTKRGMNVNPSPRLLIVDDEAVQMRALCDTLTLEGFAMTGFVSAAAALAELRAQEFDLLLTDLMMPEMDGITLLAAAREISPDVVAIVMTGHAAIDTAVKAMQAGALDYIVKPFKLAVMLPVINRALSMRQLRLANRELEQHVRERTVELERANLELEAVNRELESFYYSVSHDLRAPLRTVQGFCQMYMEDFTANIPAEGKVLLDHVAAGAQRMGHLIEDLLSLSQLGRQPLLRGTFSLEQLARRLSGECLAREPQRRVEIHIGALGTCEADPSLIEQVLVNLLSNALKFTRGRDPSVIDVDCRDEEQGTLYFVRDNGVGFKMQYADKLFGVFQRLHSESEFEGTGVGLSIVQRIVQRHGGRIWAESEPGRGTTFYFTLAPDRGSELRLPTASPPAPAPSRTPASGQGRS